MSVAAPGIRENADLRHLNTFHVAAKARWLVTITSLEQLQAVLSWQQQAQVPFMLLGQGSNVLFKQDYEGLIIELHNQGVKLVNESETFADIEVQAGEIWHDFVQSALKEHWYGLENLSLIPGTVGAAPVQNIGAYGVEVKDHLLSLEAVEISSGSLRHFSNSDCCFGYRQSWFKQEGKDRYIIWSVTFRLHKQARLVLDYPALKQALAATPTEQLTPQSVSDAVCAIRRSKLPDPSVLGNAGSFFWNPHLSQQQYSELKNTYPAMPGFADRDGVKVPAAWLIEQAGWKGYRDGDVGVHKDHALVLVNHGAATGAALVALAEQIQHSVANKFGIQLWPEVRIV